MRDWYILLVKTGQEEWIVDFLNQKLDSEDSRAFVPRKEVIFRRHGEDKVYQEIMFPGYVFMESSKPQAELAAEIQGYIKMQKGIYRFLYNEDRRDIMLRAEERDGIIAICGTGPEYCMRKSVGIMVGDKVEILSGALRGKDITIRKLNRHKRQAVIQMLILGQPKEISVALEIVKRT